MSEAQIIECPCAISTNREGVFRVDEVGAWGYTPYGIFATGHWENDEVERDLLIPYQNIAYIQFDFDALARFQEHDDGEEEPDE